MESEIYQMSSFPWPSYMFYQILVVHIMIVVGQGSDSLMSSSERTPINFFYNQVYESFFVENFSFLAVSKQKFSEEFHKEGRRHYTVHQEVEKVKSKTQQLDNTKNPSTAG